MTAETRVLVPFDTFSDILLQVAIAKGLLLLDRLLRALFTLPPPFRLLFLFSSLLFFLVFSAASLDLEVFPQDHLRILKGLLEFCQYLLFIQLENVLGSECVIFVSDVVQHDAHGG